MSIIDNLKPIASLKEISASEKELGELIGTFYDDPLGFVQSMYPWGEGSLAGETGPDQWQSEYLNSLGIAIKNGEKDMSSAIRMAICSGHGIGKTAMVSWIIHFFMSTRPNPQVVVTANTASQLSSKTWRELAKWHRLALNRHWFQWTATKFYHVLYPETWVATAIPWSKDNSEAFAGTHEKDVLVIYDEASGIDDIIWEVTEGAMTTAGAVWLVFGNPTKTDGRFFECFHKYKHRWTTKSVDSRTAKAANQAQLQEWIDDYGEDSDFARVRIKGEFPRQSATQFISFESVAESVKRRIDYSVWHSQRPVIGVDVARYGTDESIITIRQGPYVHPQIRKHGLDTMEVAGVVLDTYRKFGNDAVCCVDGVGLGAGVVDALRHRGVNVIDVQSSSKPMDPRTFVNKRAELWGKMRDWIDTSGSIPEDRDLKAQLTSIQYGLNSKLQIQLQSKEDMRKHGKTSPDLADSLAYTFAYDEAVQFAAKSRARNIRKVIWQ